MKWEALNPCAGPHISLLIALAIAVSTASTKHECVIDHDQYICAGFTTANKETYYAPDFGPVRFAEILAYAEMCGRKTLLIRLLHNSSIIYGNNQSWSSRVYIAYMFDTLTQIIRQGRWHFICPTMGLLHAVLYRLQSKDTAYR